MNQEIPNQEIPVHLLALPADLIITKMVDCSDHFEISIRSNTAFPVCAHCGSPDCAIHDYPKVKLHHLLCSGKPTVLILSKRRFRCRSCRLVFSEAYDIISPIAHITHALRMQQRIEQFGDYDKVMESLEDEGVLKSHSHFESTYFSDGYKVLSTGLILPFYAGKAYIECYYGLFAYMTKLIHMSSSNPLKGAVAVDLYG